MNCLAMEHENTMFCDESLDYNTELKSSTNSLLSSSSTISPILSSFQYSFHPSRNRLETPTKAHSDPFSHILSTPSSNSSRNSSSQNHTQIIRSKRLNDTFSDPILVKPDEAGFGNNSYRSVYCSSKHPTPETPLRKKVKSRHQHVCLPKYQILFQGNDGKSVPSLDKAFFENKLSFSWLNSQSKLVLMNLCHKNLWSFTLDGQQLVLKSFSKSIDGQKDRQAGIAMLKQFANSVNNSRLVWPQNLSRNFALWQESNSEDGVDRYYLITEYSGAQSLHEVTEELLNSDSTVSSDEALNCLTQLRSAFGYIHSLGFGYTDVYPANIMVANDKKSNTNLYTLIDLGSLCILNTVHDSTISHERFGSNEVLNGAPYTAIEDFKKLARALWAIYTGMLDHYPTKSDLSMIDLHSKDPHCQFLQAVINILYV